MQYLVAYDICSPRRLRQIHRHLKSFGIPIEKSVFLCDITESMAKALCSDLHQRSSTEDTILVFRLPHGSTCREVRGHLPSFSHEIVY